MALTKHSQRLLGAPSTTHADTHIQLGTHSSYVFTTRSIGNVTPTTTAIKELMSGDRQWPRAAPSASNPALIIQLLAAVKPKKLERDSSMVWDAGNIARVTPFLLQNHRPCCLEDIVVLRHREGYKVVKSKE